jgi:mannobiose 2-epimerase
MDKALAVWHFINTCLVDTENGEWYWSVLPDGTPDRTNDKAGFWKCPYHNGRMCFEVIKRLS